MTETLPITPDISSRKRRIAAFLIDHFVLSFLIVAGSVLIVNKNFPNENADDFKIALIGVLIPGFFLYFSKDCIKGTSLGKWIMGIMVRDEKNPVVIPSFGRLFLRNLTQIMWPIEFIVLAVSDKKKRIGDTIAHTVVLRNLNNTKVLPKALTLIGIGIAFFSFIFLFVGNAMKSSDAYTTSIKAIEHNNEILTETGGIVGYGYMPAGNINIQNEHGEAQLEIKVLGKKKDVTVALHLVKDPNSEWKITELQKH